MYITKAISYFILSDTNNKIKKWNKLHGYGMILVEMWLSKGLTAWNGFEMDFFTLQN